MATTTTTTGSSAHRTCCCHVRTFAIVIGVVESIFIVAQFVYVSVQYSKLDTSSVEQRTNRMSAPIDGFRRMVIDWWADMERTMVVGSFTAGLIGLLSAGAAILAMFLGAIWKGKRAYLIPHLVVQVTGMVAVKIGVILYVIRAASLEPSSIPPPETTTHHGHTATDAGETKMSETVIASLVLVLVLAVVLVCEIWFFYVILRFYRYLRDTTDDMESTSAATGAGSHLTAFSGCGSKLRQQRSPSQKQQQAACRYLKVPTATAD